MRLKQGPVASAAGLTLVAALGLAFGGVARAEVSEDQRIATEEQQRQLQMDRRALAAKLRGTTSRIVQIDGTELARIGFDDPNVRDVQFSPDLSRYVAMVVDRINGSSDLWLFDYRKGEKHPLTRSGKGEDVSGYAWSPDGREIAFVAVRNGQYNIYRRPVDGPRGDGELVFNNTGGDIDMSDWSKDGRYLSYNTGFVTASVDGGAIYLIDLEQGGAPIQVLATPYPLFIPRFSPDGRYVSYIGLEGGKFPIEVALAQPIGEGKGRKWRLASPDLGYEVRWTGDGSALTYCDEVAKQMLAIPIQPGSAVTHGEPAQFAAPQGVASGECFRHSADGMSLVATDQPKQPSEQIVLLDRSGGELARFGKPTMWANASLSPDGTRILAMDARDGNGLESDFWLFDVATGEGRMLDDESPIKADPVWLSDDAYTANSGHLDNGSEFNLYRRRIDGDGGAQKIFDFEPGVLSFQTADVSPDGKVLLQNISGYIAAIPLGEGAKTWDEARDVLRAEFEVGTLRYAPDMKYVAYTYNDTGRPEVYLAPYEAETASADDSKNLQVSRDGAAGGISWRADGKELYFLGDLPETPELNDFGVMAVDVSTGPRLEIGEPRQLFAVTLPPEVTAAGRQLFWRIASSDGQRFLLVQEASEGK